MSSDHFLTAISAVDGRYGSRTEKLAPYMSELALMRYRIQVEVEFLIALSHLEGFGPRPFTKDEEGMLRGLVTDFSLEDAGVIKKIETEGYEQIQATRHDVKAIEYFLRTKLAGTSLADTTEWIHFGLTSEDVNNLSYALMLRDGVEEVLLPALDSVIEVLTSYAQDHAATPMLARTHGQPASPTTFGKEMSVFHGRLAREGAKLKTFSILVKLNGATGNYNALVLAAPRIDWPSFAETVIRQFDGEGSSMSFEQNPFTTQIEPHDTYVELFQILSRVNTILVDLDQDMWRYISDGWIVQKTVEGEIGSSTMPHKVNPIDFENSEGNLLLANALFGFFATKLPISRLQRDLSDSTIERNFGLAFAHTLLGYESLSKGLSKISPSATAMEQSLSEHPEVLAEAIQTILRREGATDAYEKLLSFTRGKKITFESLQAFINELPLAQAVKDELLTLTPASYTGLAEKLSRATSP